MASTRFDQQSTKNKSIISGELAIKITQGDVNACNEFVRINQTWLLFIVRQKFAKSNNHEDIVQDTFMLVINKLQKGLIEKPQAILAFLRTTAIHIGFEYLRKDRKFISAKDQEWLDLLEDEQQDILSAIIWSGKINYVKQVIKDLKKQRDKDILIKFYFEDQDKSSICIELELSSAHFDRVLFRAKERLKLLINKDSDKSDQSNSKATINTNINNTKTKAKQFISRLIYKIANKVIQLLNPTRANA